MAARPAVPCSGAASRLRLTWRIAKKGVLDQTYDVYKNGGWTTFSVASLDISSLTDSASDLTALETYISGTDKALSKITDAATNLGAIKNRIGLQQDFVKTLTDSLDRGIGQLVDADMNAESTRLQALQTQQQLGIQALSIANARQPEHPVAVPRLIALAS